MNTNWIESLAQDVRYAGRLLRRRPVFSVGAVFTLTLGIGATTAVFSLFDALWLKNLPVEQPHELVRLAERRPDGTVAEAFTLVTHETLQRHSRTFSGLIASSVLFGRPGEIVVGDERRIAFVQFVSDNYFDVLGVRPSRGRVFHKPPPGTPGEPIAVISDDYWRRQFRGDIAVLGTRFRQGTRELTIAGIAQPGFRGTELDVPVDIWIPVDQVVAANSPNRTQGRWMRVTGRLRPGITPLQAEAEAVAILNRPIQFESGSIGYSNLRVRLFQPLVLVAVVVVLVLLVACANLANLMLAATLSREREIAVRAAIGASRLRIVRQLATESFCLSILGAVLGIALAQWTSTALLAFLPPEQAVAIGNLRFVMDLRVLGFLVLLTFATSLMSGVIPALRATGEIATSALKAGTGIGQRNRGLITRGLLIGQVIMCTVLLFLACVFVRSVQNLRAQETGYKEDGLLVADVGFPRDYRDPYRDRLIEQLRARVEALPGVEVAAFSHVGQLSGSATKWRIGFPDGSGLESLETAIEQRITPGFFKAMGTPLLAGREFLRTDDERAPLVAIVNQSFASRFLPGKDPMNARFFREGGSRSGELMTVVGVVKDSKWVNLRDDSPAMYYRPYSQMGGTPVVRLAIRTTGDPVVVSRQLLPLAQSIDEGMTLSNIVPFREIVNRTLITERLIAHVSAAFGVLALLTAGVGLYSVVAYGVARRRREMGLRIAVGASARAIEMMFLIESMTSVACGVVLGIPVALVVTRLASSLLYGLSPYDPLTIVIAFATLMSIAVAASYLPARRAARTDPLVALREE